MTLLSAIQDVQQTTLAAVRGVLRRLEYLAHLQDDHGGYSHWGMARMHGDSATQEALAQAHRSALSRVLATPIGELLEDIEKSSQNAGVRPEVYAYRLTRRKSSMLPSDPGAGSELHLKSVLHALWSLLKIRNQDASRPSAWPLPPPDRSLPPPAGNAGLGASPGKADGASRQSPHV